MLMLLFATHQLSSIIGDSGFVVSSVLLSAVTLLSSDMSTGNRERAPMTSAAVKELQGYQPRVTGAFTHRGGGFRTAYSEA